MTASPASNPAGLVKGCLGLPHLLEFSFNQYRFTLFESCEKQERGIVETLEKRTRQPAFDALIMKVFNGFLNP